MTLQKHYHYDHLLQENIPVSMLKNITLLITLHIRYDITLQKNRMYTDWSDVISALKGHKIHLKRFKLGKHVLIANVKLVKFGTFNLKMLFFPTDSCSCSRKYMPNI